MTGFRMDGIPDAIRRLRIVRTTYVLSVSRATRKLRLAGENSRLNFRFAKKKKNKTCLPV